MPPCSLMAPWVQVGTVGVETVVVLHLTPASSMCPQLWVPKEGRVQSTSLLSVPRHRTSSNQITPEPVVKPVVRATAPIKVVNELKHNSVTYNTLNAGYLAQALTDLVGSSAYQWICA